MVKVARLGPNVSRFPVRVAKDSFGISADVTVQPAGFGRFGTLTVPAQQLVTFGSSGLKAGGIEGDPIFIDLRNSSDASIEGRVRARLVDGNDREIATVFEERTERLRASQNDRNSARLLPEFGIFVPEDCRLVLELYPDSATAVTIQNAATNFKILVPITRAYA